jgi:hypothetical protein
MTASTLDNDQDVDRKTIHYTVHHNWSWIFSEAILQLSNNKTVSTFTNTDIHLYDRCRELPSQKRKLSSKEKVKYALFRVEIESNEDPSKAVETKETISTWATSLAFAFLDPKDALYRELRNNDAGHLMPPTTLLKWDVTDVEEIGEMPSFPAILKAALGSGGFGLYFVNDREDVLSIIKAHAIRARTFDGFLESLKKDYGGEVPYWSLQSLVNSYRVCGDRSTSNGNSERKSMCDDNRSRYEDEDNENPENQKGKRCQIRVYVVSCGSQMYMYETFESRIPSWDVDLDDALTSSSSTFTSSHMNAADTPSSESEINDINVETEEKILTIEEFERYCCEGTNARPYNKDRNKSVTDRFVFDELEELLIGKEIVQTCVHDAMIALKIPILNQIKGHSDVIKNDECLHNNDKFYSKHSEMAIAGIDLMLEVPSGQQNDSPVLTAYILEINNNPAMAGESKRMSELYKEHLIDFAKNLIQLGLSFGTEHSGFQRIF